MSTIVFVHAHPDDESSKGAATLAYYADKGYRVLVVTLTGGERGDILKIVPEGKQDVVSLIGKAPRVVAGEVFEARGRLVKPGAQIMVCEAEVWEIEPQERLIMTMTATMFIMNREGG